MDIELDVNYVGKGVKVNLKYNNGVDDKHMIVLEGDGEFLVFYDTNNKYLFAERIIKNDFFDALAEIQSILEA